MPVEAGQLELSAIVRCKISSQSSNLGILLLQQLLCSLSRGVEMLLDVLKFLLQHITPQNDISTPTTCYCILLTALGLKIRHTQLTIHRRKKMSGE